MNDPKLEHIERELRAMTEPTRESTELWKRALEISRSEERAGLVHPAADRPMPSHHRRILYALNGVGVAALIALAVGVWTLGRGPMQPAADPMAASESASRGEPGMSIFAEASDPEDAVMLEDEPAALAMDTTFGLREELDSIGYSRQDAMERSIADASAPAAKASDGGLRADASDEDDRGLAQMEQAYSSGLVLSDAEASIMSAGWPLENAEIVIEVADIEAANRALAELPDPALSEFNFAPVGEGTPAEAQGALPVQVNVSPARMEETLGRIRGLGRVVDEKREPDTLANRAQVAVELAAESLAPSADALRKVVGDEGLDEHARAHRGLGADEFEELDAVRDSIASLVERLDHARRAMNLSQIRVNFRQAGDAGTIEE